MILEILAQLVSLALVGLTVYTLFNHRQRDTPTDNRVKYGWRVIAGLMAIASTSSFACFILEETIQRGGMGVYVAQSNGYWRLAYKAIQQQQNSLQQRRKAMFWMSTASPIGTIFRDYVKQEQQTLNTIQLTIEHELGIDFGHYVNGSRIQYTGATKVWVSTNGRRFHPPWSELVTKYNMKPVSLAYARTKAMIPAQSWKEQP